MNSLIKLLCNILNNRLSKFCFENKLINKSQLGFQKEARTADHIFTLKTIINKYVTEKKGKKLYACFIDLKKAFDSVWHEGLFRKLENNGINGKFLELIKNIYNKTKCAVKLNEKLTNFFPYSKGVQQGNLISPTLFNLYINDIFEAIQNDSCVSLDNVTSFNALMYADDLILLSTSKTGLQANLNSLQSYCQKWKFSINQKKSKVMIFKKGTQNEDHTFTINNEKIEIVKEYKYLGITINCKNCSFKPSLSDLQCRGNRALYSIASKIPIKSVLIK